MALHSSVYPCSAKPRSAVGRHHVIRHPLGFNCSNDQLAEFFERPEADYNLKRYLCRLAAYGAVCRIM